MYPVGVRFGELGGIIAENFNRWIRNLWAYLLSTVLGGIEAGHPHVHLLMIFHDYEFRIDARKSKNSKYRIAEKEAFEKSWDSFVDV
jgi:hypothetical protein